MIFKKKREKERVTEDLDKVIIGLPEMDMQVDEYRGEAERG